MWRLLFYTPSSNYRSVLFITIIISARIYCRNKKQMIALYFDILTSKSFLFHLRFQSGAKASVKKRSGARKFHFQHLHHLRFSRTLKKEKHFGNLRGFRVSASNLKKRFYSRGNRKSLLRMQEERCKKTHRWWKRSMLSHATHNSIYQLLSLQKS